MFRRTKHSSKRTRLGRPTPAMAVACTALFMALGGVGYAAATVGSSQIKNNSVQGKDIKNSTVQGKDIKNSTVQEADISPATRNALKGQTGSQGSAGQNGQQGVQGVQGVTGPRGPSALRVAADANIDVPACGGGALADCTALLSRSLAPGSWLIQAKFLLDNNDGVKSGTTDTCGIVSSLGGVVDKVRIPSLGATGQAGEAEVVTLSGVLPGQVLSPTVSLRCNEQAGESLFVEDAKITALQVETVVGP